MKTFKELNLIAPLQRALNDENYQIPTPIQAQTIPASLDNRDILGCAQTGTGKTAAFALPILDRLGDEDRRATPNRPEVLVLAPTRELAIQIGQSFATYGKHLRVRQALIYGGVNQNSQVRALNSGAHVVIATPGRLLDLMEQGHIKLDRLSVFVLDEADRMMDMGFMPDLKRIIRELPRQRQSLFFSATLPPKIVELSRRLLHDPVSVNVTPETTSVQRIEQQVMFLSRPEKVKMLYEIVSGDDAGRTIVFTRTKRGANRVAEKLTKQGIKAAAIHGNKSQNARQRALDAFRKNFVQVLVATDVAARGIDIDGVTHVINFDIPVEAESYVHRIGRTGRAGAEGIAISFCSSEERGDLRAIEKLIDQKVPLAPGHRQPYESAPAERSNRTPSRRPAASRSRKPGSQGSSSKSNSQRSTSRASDQSAVATSSGKPSHHRKGGKSKRRVAPR